MWSNKLKENTKELNTFLQIIKSEDRYYSKYTLQKLNERIKSGLYDFYL